MVFKMRTQSSFTTGCLRSNECPGSYETLQMMQPFRWWIRSKTFIFVFNFRPIINLLLKVISPMDPSFFFGSPGTRLDKIQKMTSHGLTTHNCREDDDDDDDNGNNLILQCLEHSK